jgi:uncharacterized protein YgbK (DUF1537 family)
VPVLTEWSANSLQTELKRGESLIYILSNSRSLVKQEAKRITAEITENLLYASKESNRQIEVISRSDSTLRGHFPEETDELKSRLDSESDITVLVPFFKEGGRLTVGDVHYVCEGDTMIPASQIPFASDPVFGYKNSHLF